MKKQKSNSFDSDWLRRNSEKEYGLEYEEALELSYDNLRILYDQLAEKKDEILQREREAIERPLLAEIDSLRVVVRGLATANIRDVEHMQALQRMAKAATKYEWPAKEKS